MRGFCVEGVRKMWVTGSALWLRVRKKAALSLLTPSPPLPLAQYPPPLPSPPLPSLRSPAL